MNFSLSSKGCMQVPSHLVAMGSVYVGFFDTQSSHTLKNIFGKFREKKKQRTKNKINKNECSDWNDWCDKYQKTE